MWDRWRSGANAAAVMGIDEQYVTPFGWARKQVRDPWVAAQLGLSPYGP